MMRRIAMALAGVLALISNPMHSGTAQRRQVVATDVLRPPRKRRSKDESKARIAAAESKRERKRQKRILEATKHG